MSFQGEDIRAQFPTEYDNVPSPWETIELEEADREPKPLAIVATGEASPRAPLRVAAEPPAAVTFSATAPSEFSRDSQGDAVPASDGRNIATIAPGTDTRGLAQAKNWGLQIANCKLQIAAKNPLPPICNPQLPPSSLNPDSLNPEPSRGGGWTIPLVCLGIGLIACCAIIPQADANRRLAYQKVLLQRDLESIQKQVSVNDEFLKRVYDDGSLAERLAQRQMNVVPAGNRVWRNDRTNDAQSMSPYGLTIVPKPEPFAPYQPTGGQFAALCRDPRTNLYLTGAALMMLAAGLVMGIAPGQKAEGGRWKVEARS